jgi:hypothetical protein
VWRHERFHLAQPIGGAFRASNADIERVAVRAEFVDEEIALMGVFRYWHPGAPSSQKEGGHIGPPSGCVNGNRTPFCRASLRNKAHKLYRPGAAVVTLECLPKSGLPNALADRGYDLTPQADSEHILPFAI